jgi:NAD-reducing hydrogenase large subunit
VSDEGALELYDGKLRAIDSEGNITLDDISTDDYDEYFSEAVERWSYMKFPYLKNIGREKAGIRVGTAGKNERVQFHFDAFSRKSQRGFHCIYRPTSIITARCILIGRD